MKTNYIKVTEFCNNTKVEHTFISTLRDEGIIKIDMVDDEDVIDEEILPDLEMFTRWHYDLGINTAGIDAMRHMLARMNQMQEELNSIRKRLSFFED